VGVLRGGGEWSQRQGKRRDAERRDDLHDNINPGGGEESPKKVAYSTACEYVLFFVTGSSIGRGG